MPDPRVDDRVEDVHDKVYSHVDCADEQRRALDDGVVTLGDPFQQQRADAGAREHLLRNDCSGQKGGELQPEDGDHGNQRILQYVTQDDASF